MNFFTAIGVFVCLALLIILVAGIMDIGLRAIFKIVDKVLEKMDTNRIVSEIKKRRNK